MPLYEYKCHKCAQVFEVLQKFADATLETHAVCGGTVERLLSASAFQFKGSGFYITDYRNKHAGGNGSNKGDGNGKSEGSKAESSKSEAPTTKPAESKPSTSSTESAAKT